MAKFNYNINEFNWRHLFNDSKGKTSMSLLVAFLMSVASIIGFLWSIYSKYNDGIIGAIAFAGVAGGLLGIRRFTPDGQTQQLNNTANAAETPNV
jgi:hypothetical protein